MVGETHGTKEWNYSIKPRSLGYVYYDTMNLVNRHLFKRNTCLKCYTMLIYGS